MTELDRVIHEPGRLLIVTMLAAVVEDAWNERLVESRAAHKRLAARMSDLDLRRNRLVDAYLAGRGIDQCTYERQAQRLDQ